MAQSESADFFSSLAARIEVDEGDLHLLSLEIPAILTCSDWKQLAATPGVYKIFHHHCMFADCRHRKYQVVYTNIPEMFDEVELLCKSDAVCFRIAVLT